MHVSKLLLLLPFLAAASAAPVLAERDSPSEDVAKSYTKRADLSEDISKGYTKREGLDKRG